MLHHFNQPKLYEDNPNMELLPTGSTAIINLKQKKINVTKIVQKKIYNGLYCRECGVKDIIILSELVKHYFNLTKISDK